MFEPVGASDITFHLNERPDILARKVKMWERDSTNHQELNEVTDFWWPEPVIDDIGGGGIYTNVPELLKIYLGVLQGKLLRPETLESMFKPHLESHKGLDNPADHCLANRNAIYNAVPNNIPVDYGLGGLLNTVDVPGRRSQYSLSWSGLPNCYWVCINIDSPPSLTYLSVTDIFDSGSTSRKVLLECTCPSFSQPAIKEPSTFWLSSRSPCTLRWDGQVTILRVPSA